MSTIKNASPQVYARGVDDQSIRQMPYDPIAVPTHLPHIWTFAPKGGLEPELVVGSSLVNMFGVEVADEAGPYATHATALLNKVNAAGNAIMVQRVLPSDAGPKATLRVYMDVLEDTIQLYQRNTDGSFKLDPITGLKMPDGTNTTAGHKVYFYIDNIPPDPMTGDDMFGQGTIVPGSQTDGSGNQSQRIPIMDLRVPHFGAAGNDHGISIWAPTIKSSSPVDDALLRDVKAYPFRFAFLRRDKQGLGKRVASVFGEQYIDCVFKPDQVNRRMGDKEISIKDRLIQEYERLNVEGETDRFGPFHELFVYEANVETLVQQFYAKELPVLGTGIQSDFEGVTGEDWVFNFVSGRSSRNVPYHSYEILNTDPNASILVENTGLYASGGSDGTMGEASFATLVEAEANNYLDPDHPWQEVLRYPQSIVYDSGFPLETKYALMSVMAVRKDIACVISTYDTQAKQPTVSEESSLAIALRSRAMLFPESEYYGTPAFRCMIVGHNGKLLGSKYRGKLPLSLEIATNSSNYMGAANRVWRSAYRFDNAPGSIVKLFADVSNVIKPQSVRNMDWDNGLVWVQSYRLKSLFFPALKTVNPNDTSVLNSYFTMMACVELQKIGHRAWSQITGASNLTREQVIERNNNFINSEVEGVFDDRFIITPETYFDEDDVARGFSHHTKIIIQAPNMQTVSVLTIEAQRIDPD